MNDLLPCKKHGTVPTFHSRSNEFICAECLQEQWVRRRARHKLDERKIAAERWNATQKQTGEPGSGGSEK